MKPLPLLQQFDAFLVQRALRFEGVVIGGTALALLGVIDRETRDCDVLDPEIPEPVTNAAREFAHAQTRAGQPLDEHWLNNGPQDLKRTLPEGWSARLQPAFSGKAVELQTLGRKDLLATKLFALCDRETDAQDCLRLAPTRAEVEALLPWVAEQDANELWPAHVEKRLERLLAEVENVRP